MLSVESYGGIPPAAATESESRLLGMEVGARRALPAAAYGKEGVAGGRKSNSARSRSALVPTYVSHVEGLAKVQFVYSWSLPHV